MLELIDEPATDAMELIPDIGVPYSPSVKYVDLRERADAACNTAVALENFGLDVNFSDMDMEAAASLVTAYGENPLEVSKSMSIAKTSSMTPASLVLVSSILKEFSHNVAKSALDIRNLVTNKLILETEHADARVRLRAMEMLGKISDVALFTEKSEIKVTAGESTGDIREALKKKLHKMIDEDEEANIVDVE